MRSSRISELSERVEKLVKEFVAAKKENARLKRLLSAAESKIKKMTTAKDIPVNGGLTAVTKQLEKMKDERRMIKSKVEKMSARLDKFFEA
ncbi:MAG: hypothetical protein ACE5EN_10615 [Nitrospinota bacterium]